MKAIYKKELKSYFTSVIGCLFIAITLLIEGGFFVMYNLSYGTPYIIYVISNGMLILVFTIPILTMKILADEKKQKTDQLILTAPVSVGKIVIGKYMALSTIYIIPMLITCIYPLILTTFGDVPLKMSYTEILGMTLYGLVFIAIGMFISSITESQVIAAIVSIVVLFIGYMMSNVTNMVSAEGNIITQMLNCFDLFSPAQEFLNGMIDFTSVVYYVSIIVLFLFLTMQSIQKRKWSVSKNTLSTSVFSTTFIAVAIAVTVFINLIAGKVSENVTWASIDMTDQRLYAITDDTVDMLADVQDEIIIYVLGDKSGADTTVDETLKRYERANKKIKVEYKNITKYPNFYKEYTDTAPTSNSLIVVNKMNGKSKIIDYSEIYETSMDYTTYQTTTTGYDGEGRITSAISYVTSEDNATIYVVTGHNETGMGESFTDAVEKLNIAVEEINLLNYEEISTEDCEMMMLLSPQSDYSKDDASKVIDYLKAGGKVLMTTSYVDSGLDNFNSIAQYYGVEILNGIVAENDSSHYYQSPFYVLASDGTGYAAGVSNYLFFGYPQGMYLDKDSDNYRETITYTELVKTTDQAVCKMNPNTAYEYNLEDGDEKGPFSLAISLTESIDDEETGESVKSSLTIVSSNSLFTDEFNTLVAGANLEMFKNIIGDYVETVGEAAAVPVKATNYTTLTITNSGIRLVGIIIAIILPIGILVIGIGIWTKRRRK